MNYEKSWKRLKGSLEKILLIYNYSQRKGGLDLTEKAMMEAFEIVVETMDGVEKKGVEKA